MFPNCPSSNSYTAKKVSVVCGGSGTRLYLRSAAVLLDDAGCYYQLRLAENIFILISAQSVHLPKPFILAVQ